MLESLERTMFTVESGMVDLYGWIEERDNDFEGFEDDEYPRHVLVTGDWPMFEHLDEPLVDWAAPYQQYSEDFHREEAEQVVDMFGGTHLPLRDVTRGTPDGNYWCYFEEE